MNQLDPHIFLQKIQKANKKTLSSFGKQNVVANDKDEKLSELALIQNCQELQTRSDQAVSIIKNCKYKIDMKEPLKSLLECEKLLLWGNFLVKSLDNIDESNISTDQKLILVDIHRYSDRFLEASIRILLLFDEILSILVSRITGNYVDENINNSEVERLCEALFVVGFVMFFVSNSMSLKKSQVLSILKHELENFANFEKNKREGYPLKKERFSFDQFRCIVEDMSRLKMVAVEPTVELVAQCVSSNSECRELLNEWIFLGLTTTGCCKDSLGQNDAHIWEELVRNGMVEYDIYSMCGMCSVVQLDAETIEEIYYGRIGKQQSVWKTEEFADQRCQSELESANIVAHQRRMVLDSVTRMVLQGRLVCHVEQNKDADVIVFEDAENIDAEHYLAKVLHEVEQL